MSLADAPRRGYVCKAQDWRALTATLGTEITIVLNRNAVASFTSEKTCKADATALRLQNQSLPFPRVANFA
jgi:hypothetical protein